MYIDVCVVRMCEWWVHSASGSVHSYYVRVSTETDEDDEAGDAAAEGAAEEGETQVPVHKHSYMEHTRTHIQIIGHAHIHYTHIFFNE